MCTTVDLYTLVNLNNPRHLKNTTNISYIPTCHKEFGPGTEYCLLAVAPPGHLSAKLTGSVDCKTSLTRHLLTL